MFQLNFKIHLAQKLQEFLVLYFECPDVRRFQLSGYGGFLNYYTWQVPLMNQGIFVLNSISFGHRNYNAVRVLKDYFFPTSKIGTNENYDS